MVVSWLLNEHFPIVYRKVPKFSDAGKLCCILHTIQTKRPNIRVFYQNYVNVIAKEQSDLGLHCLPRLICLIT